MKTRRLRKRNSRRETVHINLSAFEIVRRGSQIVIESRLPIDERALASGLRLDKMRAKPVMSDKGHRVVLKVDDSFPAGRNTLFMSDLYTPKNHPIDADLELPFFVVDSKAPFPKDVKVESYSCVAVHGESIQRASSGEGARYELMKGTQRGNGRPWGAAYDGDSKRVDFNQVRAQVMKARLERYGKLQPKLHERVTGGGTEPLSVAIWLRAGSLVKRAKAERRETRKAPAGETGARKAFSEQAQRFVEQYGLEAVGRHLRIDGAAPVIFAELDRQTIRRLAEAQEVSMIFLYDREGVEDLSNSIAIAESDDAHALGYTGSGVKVAVYENGPDDTTDLRITARYRNDPTTSQHSRHTHGIIKNRERGKPHGHAPDCLLHSANDKDLDAIRWAVDRGCTVISQSFHREAEQTDTNLSFDDIYKDWLALNWPYPTICEAAGNGADSEFVNHKGYNRLTVANHNDPADGMASDTVFRNPNTTHGDRELPEIAANGMGVTTVGLTMSGTSMAAPAVAGATACMQQVNSTLKSWPEGCRAIHLAAATLNPDGGTWWSDLIGGSDGLDGTGALNTLNAVYVAEQRKGRNNTPSALGWDVGTLRSRDIGSNGETAFSYRISVPRHVFRRTTVKVALAWDSDVIEFSWLGATFPIASVLTLDLDLKVYDSAGKLVGYSGSWDNSYEIAEFRAIPGENYTIKIRRWSGTDDVWYGISWNTTTTPLIPVRDLAGTLSPARLRRLAATRKFGKRGVD